MNQRQRQVATLVAAGFTTAETASQLGISTSTVDRARALPDVAALIEQNEAEGLDPRAVLNALLYSKDQNIRMRAAVELAKLPESDQPLPAKLPVGVKRVTIEDHEGTTSTRVYPAAPEFDDGSDPDSDYGKFNAELARLGERDFQDPHANTLDHFRIAQDLVYPAAK